MLAIRLKRLGRKGQPVYRVIVQEAQRHPSSGRVVAYVGHYNPHSKEYKLDIEVIEAYLKNGAQPTPRVVKLLVDAKVKLPTWVVKPKTDKQGKTRFADKLRKNRPAEPEQSAESTEAAPEAENPAETPSEAPEAPAEEPEKAAVNDTAVAPEAQPEAPAAPEAETANEAKA
jgi:small subunit ribosomal protein S16